MSATTSALFNLDLSDIDLMTRARHGDHAAYSQVVKFHQNRLYNAMLRLVGDPTEAAELTHETFSRGLARIEDFPPESQPYAWLFRMALNLAVSAIRRARRPHDFAAADDPAHRRVLEALGRLETDYRAVLVLRDIESFDYQQMAQVLNLPLSGVKSRLFRARLALRDEMRD